GLLLLEPLEEDDRIARHHRFRAVRAHLLEMSDDLSLAHEEYLLAARHTASIPEQRYLRSKADRLRP
ncbi:RNA polymerase sigma factor, partial [Streptomyces anulatus]